MERHYEVMRIMLTKIVDPRELMQGVDSLFCVEEAIRYRVNTLTSMSAALRLEARRAELVISSDNFTHQKQDIQKQFENFAFGIVIISFLIHGN
jgi:hypothetical protein